MGYEISLNKAWQGLAKLKAPKELSVRFLADEYTINQEKKTVNSVSCNVPAKDYLAIILLHYLAKKADGLPAPCGEWLNFRELAGIEGYQDAFRKRVIDPIIRKYGRKPEGLFEAAARFGFKKTANADAGVILEPLEKVPVLIELWRSDDEFAPEANLLFDRTIRDVFCIEDVIVLAEMVVHNL